MSNSGGRANSSRAFASISGSADECGCWMTVGGDSSGIVSEIGPLGRTAVKAEGRSGGGGRLTAVVGVHESLGGSGTEVICKKWR